MALTDRWQFQDYIGPIPKVVPALRTDNRVFVGGNLALNERLRALNLDGQITSDLERIGGWGMCLGLSDLCATFEDLAMLQTDSGFLTGIRGIVERDGQTYIAVDAEAVKSAISTEGFKYFIKQLSQIETVTYLYRGKSREEQAQNVVLFPYNGRFFELDADQFRAINGKTLKRDGVVHDRDMSPGEIVDGGQVIHPAWGIYDVGTIVPLVQEQKSFRFQDRDYNFDALMGFYLPDAPSGNGSEGRALYISGLFNGSRLSARADLDRDIIRVFGQARGN